MTARGVPADRRPADVSGIPANRKATQPAPQNGKEKAGADFQMKIDAPAFICLDSVAEGEATEQYFAVYCHMLQIY